MKNKMLIIITCLLALSLLVVSCTTATTGEAKKDAGFQLPGSQPQISTAFSCSLKKNCDSILALYAKVDSLQNEVTDLKYNFEALREKIQYIPTSKDYFECVSTETGCPNILTVPALPDPPSCLSPASANGCADAAHLLCVSPNGITATIVDCTLSGYSGTNICSGEGSAAQCSYE